MIKKILLCAVALMASLALASPSVYKIDRSCEAILEANLDWSLLSDQSERQIEKMKQLVEEVENNPAPPDFSNTIEAIDEFFGMPPSMEFLFAAQVNTEPTVAVADGFRAKIEKLQTEMLLNQNLFARVEAIYNQRLNLELTPEQVLLTQVVYEKFVRAGVRLSEEKRLRLVEIREQLSSHTRDFEANIRNGWPDFNLLIVFEIYKLRDELARLLGYEKFADYRLASQMAKDVLTVDHFLGELQNLYKKQVGIIRSNFAWRKYELEPYLEVNSVLEGTFRAFHKLFGVTITRIPDSQTWDDSVQLYQVQGTDGSALGLLYLDLFKRKDKHLTGFELTYRQRVNGKLQARSLVSTGFSEPEDGQPKFLDPTELTVLYHELGHAFHELLSRSNYHLLAGVTSLPLEFVEGIATLFEQLSRDPQIIREYAKHYYTGKPISAALVMALRATPTWPDTEYLNLTIKSKVDLDRHKAGIKGELDFLDLETSVSAPFEKWLGKEAGGLRIKWDRHGFARIEGYASAYYSYAWAQMLADGMYSVFEREGTFQAGSRFLSELLSVGNSSEGGADLYRNFVGSDPDLGKFLKREEKRFAQEEAWKRKLFWALLFPAHWGDLKPFRVRVR